MKQPDKITLTKAEVWKLWKRSNIGRDKNLIQAIWSFKQKCLPDGTYIKHKAQLCAHQSMQVEGEHF